MPLIIYWDHMIVIDNDYINKGIYEELKSLQGLYWTMLTGIREEYCR